MKILLLNPPTDIPLPNGKILSAVKAGSGWPYTYERKAGGDSGSLPFPLYLSTAAALLEKEQGVEVFVRDSIMLDETEQEMLRYVHRVRPDIILWEVPTVTIDEEVRLAKNLKVMYPKMAIIWCGAHVTALPKETMELVGSSVDYIIKGEYEIQLLSLVKEALVGNWPSFGIICSDMPVDMKTCPYPARHLFPTNEAPNPCGYSDGFYTTFPAAVMWASRGCIHDCPYCAEINLIEFGMRIRTPKDVCDEIDFLMVRWGVKHIYFDDNNFTGNVIYTAKICDEMIARGIPNRITWSAMCSFMGRTSVELLDKMKAAGCTGVKFGVDSADETVLKELRRPLDLEKCKALVLHCNRIGIKTHATMAIGHFSDTRATLDKALAYLKELTVDTIQVSIAAPFPGLEMYERLKNAGRLKDTHWRNFSGTSKSVVLFPAMDADYVEKFRDKMDREWVRHKLLHDWSWKWRHLKYVLRDMWGNPFLLLRRVKQVISALKW